MAFKPLSEEIELMSSGRTGWWSSVRSHQNTQAPGSERIYGVTVGVVTNNQDPDGRFRVKVELKYYFQGEESDWLRIAMPLAGPEMGMYMLPEVHDEVLVSFLNGDPNSAIVIGCLFNGKDKFPQKIKTTPDNKELAIPNSEQGGKNNYRFFHSRSGHTLMFSDEEGKCHVSMRTMSGNEFVMDDTDGKEKIQLYDKDNKQWMEIDVPKKTITIQTDTGDICLKAKKKILLECEDFELKASKTIKTDSGTTTDLKVGTAASIKSGGGMVIKNGGDLLQNAPMIKLNC